MPLRLFIGIEMPSAIKTQIADVIAELDQSRTDVRWEQIEKLHVTLKFLGNTREDLLHQLVGTLEVHAKEVLPFFLTFKNVGCFPNKRDPRIIWVGAEEPSGSLHQLVTSIESAMATLGFEKETRPFHAHVTLGRVKSNRKIRNLIARMESITFESQPTLVTEICLFKSELKPNGSVYTIAKKFGFQPE